MRIAILSFFLFQSLLVEARLPDLIPYRKGNLWGYCDSTKKMVIEPQWEECTFFYKGVATVKQSGKWGAIDSIGNYLLTPGYYRLNVSISSLLVAAIDDKHVGVIDIGGRVIIPFKYHNVYVLTSTRFIAYKDKKHAGLITERDSLLVPFRARWIARDADSVLACAWPGEMFVCDLNGRPILMEHEYLDMDGGVGDAAKFGLFIVIRLSDCNKWHDDSMDYIVVDTSDHQIFPGKYQNIKLLGDTVFECETADTTVYFDLNGSVAPDPYTIDVMVREKSLPYRGYKPPPEWYLMFEHCYENHYQSNARYLGVKDYHGTKYWED